MSQTLSRRALVAAGLAGGLSLGLGGLRLARAQTRFGILGRQAPLLRVLYWIDASGAPTRFDPRVIEGRWVFLKCFQSWCPGCHKHGFPTLKEVVDAFGSEERVQILAVQTVFEGFGVNTRDKVREIQLQYELPILMGHDAGDPDGDHRPRTMRDYRTGGTPWIVVAAPDGEVIFNDYQLNAKRFIAFLNEQLAGA